MIIKCAECNMDYDVTGLKPGTRIRCRECSRYLTVPGGKVVACLSCGQLFSSRPMRPGVRFRCSKCGTVMEMGRDGVPRIARNTTGSKRIHAVEEAREGSDPGVREVEATKKYGADRQAQRKAPPPTVRRFPQKEKETPEEIFKKYKIRAAFMVGEDGTLLSALSEDAFDAEMISNAAYYLDGARNFFAAQFGAQAEAARFDLGEVKLRMRKIGDRLLMTVSSGRYDGEADDTIAGALEKSSDLQMK